MMKPPDEVTKNLLELVESTGYPLIQHNGERKFGPPPEWAGPPPPKGCEVFIAKLPRDIFEDQLVPLFTNVGKIYEFRLKMDWSGSNRGYAFVKYTTESDAVAAVKQLNNYQIRPGTYIAVVKSADNCRLYVGGLPKNKTKDEVLEEILKYVSGVKDVILYTCSYDRRLNRGFAFVEFTSHLEAAMARRVLRPGGVKLWGLDASVDWADPEPEIDDEQMSKVKVLYVRNFLITTTKAAIANIFENAISHKIEHINKIKDYAFIHFEERAHAEMAISKLQGVNIDGVNIEIRWAKPVDRELYRIQKFNRGNSKFNRSLDFTQTLLLYNRHLEKREYEEDEAISPECAFESQWGSSEPNTKPLNADYNTAPAKLDAMCKRYMWAPPSYEYTRNMCLTGDQWTSRIVMPQVGQPLLSSPYIGPLVPSAKESRQQAFTEAALSCTRNMCSDLTQRSTVNSATPHLLPTPMLPAVLPQMQSYIGMQYHYMNAPMSRSPPTATPNMCSDLTQHSTVNSATPHLPPTPMLPAVLPQMQGCIGMQYHYMNAPMSRPPPTATPNMCSDLTQRSTVNSATPHLSPTPMLPAVLPQMQSCIGMQYHYMNAPMSRSPPTAMPNMCSDLTQHSTVNSATPHLPPTPMPPAVLPQMQSCIGMQYHYMNAPMSRSPPTATPNMCSDLTQRSTVNSAMPHLPPTPMLPAVLPQMQSCIGMQYHYMNAPMSRSPPTATPNMCSGLTQRSTVNSATPHLPPTPMLPAVLPQMQSCIGMQYDYMNAPMSRSPPTATPVLLPPMSRTD